MLLGLVIEETTGMSVAAALRSHILADPRLSSLVYQVEERPKGPLALPFAGQLNPNIGTVGEGYLPSKAEASAPSGSGGMASDSGALALWGYLLFGRHLLSERVPEGHDRLRRPARPTTGTGLACSTRPTSPTASGSKLSATEVGMWAVTRRLCPSCRAKGSSSRS